MAVDVARLAGNARRVFIVGASGTGKSTLAARMGAAIEVPVHDLDLVFREGGGNGPQRVPEAITADIAAIAGSPDGWVADGLHLESTDALLDAADLIVWLDDAGWGRNSGRIVRRFFGGAWSTARSQRDVRSFFRFRDYGRHARELFSAFPQARRYQTAPAGGSEVTREDVAAWLRPYESKVVRCSSPDETRSLLSQLRSVAARPS